MASAFELAIKDHLALRRRNAVLEKEMPIDRYRASDEVENHALFKPESEARQEETLVGIDESGWPLREEDTSFDVPDELWSNAPAFDWGD